MREELLQAVQLLTQAALTLSEADDQPLVEEAISQAEDALKLMRAL